MTDNLLGEAQARFVDYLSFGLIVGSVADVLPAIATLLTIVWMSIRIFETPTVQRVLERLFGRKPTIGGGDGE